MKEPKYSYAIVVDDGTHARDVGVVKAANRIAAMNDVRRSWPRPTGCKVTVRRIKRNPEKPK